MTTPAAPPLLPIHQQAVVIGGGQAGLATAAAIQTRDIPATVLDAGPEIGHVWRSRWDSLRLFTSAGCSSLTGLDFPGDPARYPGKEEVADYLRSYAATFHLDVRTSVRVDRISADRNGFEVATTHGTMRTQHVVVATGPFQTPVMPMIAAGLGPAVAQVHSAAYRRPADLPEGPVVVVGGGNSGFQIAAELAATHPVQLAVGTRPRSLPQRLAGRDLFWWLSRTGVLAIPADSRMGRRMQQRELLIGSSPRSVRRLGVALRPRLDAAEGDTVRFADGSRSRVRAVVWATGYRRHHDFIDIPDIRDRNRVLIQHGVRTLFPGLYAVGQPQQRDRGSALLGFVGREAAEIADLVAIPSTEHTAVRTAA
jgi:putative flavoprotein involved in K+ transport